jgi:16S rRNA processing protein RimM
LISLTSDVASRHAVGATFTIVESAGHRTLTIATVRPQQDRFVVHFEGVDDRNDAEKMTNKFLYAEPVENEDGLWVHQLIGSNVVDTAGESWGTCTGVLQNPAHDILEIEGGLLVPAPFIVTTDGTTTVINPPAGLREALSGE